MKSYSNLDVLGMEGIQIRTAGDLHLKAPDMILTSLVSYSLEIIKVLVIQAFRFIVGTGHCAMISKYGPSLSMAVGPVDPSFLVVKISHFNKKYSTHSESINSTKQKVHIGCQYSRTCLKQPLKKGETKNLTKNCSLMKVERIAESSLQSILQYF